MYEYPRLDSSPPIPITERMVDPSKVDVEAAERAARDLLIAIGADIEHEGMRETPRRVAASFAELVRPEEFVATTFPNEGRYDEIVILRDITFHTLCMHHLLPFHGVAHVAYVPGDTIIGVSKLARVVERFARDLQVQERMTMQIADWLERELQPRGIGVVLEAEHLCMTIRGVRKPGAKTTTSALRGLIRDDARTRQELMSLSADGAAGAPLIEAVVTTTAPGGRVNCAAIGVRWGDEELVLRPFRGTRTLRNLERHGEAVVNLTDDVLLFVEAALGDPRPALRPAQVVRGSVIEGASSWREVVVTAIDDDEGGLPRARVRARVVASGRGESEPLGLCRARHAAVEASILASRLRLLDRAHVDSELDRLQEIVDRTAGARERAAMDYVRRYVAARAS